MTRLALCCAAVAAVMPGLALDVARVGNDCLAVLLFTLLTWLGNRQIVEGRVSWGLGVILGLALLTKAYFLVAIPPVLLLTASSVAGNPVRGPAFQRALLWLLGVYLALWAGQLYNVTLLCLTKGLAASMGWYLYAVVAAEVTLCTGGLAAVWRWAPAGGVALFALLDFYTIHAVAVPYYTGVIADKANGAISAIHLANWRVVEFEGTVERLTAFKAAWVSRPLMVAVWLAYLVATAWKVVDTVRRPVD